MIKRLVFPALFALISLYSAAAQPYKFEPITSAAPGLPGAFGPAIQDQGYRVVGPAGPWCEIWFAKSIPAGKSSDASIAFGIPQGTLLGILRFPAKGADRRGQVIPPGVYTVRYSNFPVDGAHSGAAPQRDFGLLTPVAEDTDPAAKPAFDALLAASRKASGTPHPAVFSLETPPQGAAAPSVVKEGDHDWVLTVKAGDVTLSIILVGKVEG
jgi:hypothetical protein